MHRIVLLCAVFILVSCVSKPEKDEKVSITGTRVSKEEAEKLNLKPVGTLCDLLKGQLENVPKINDDMSCKSAQKELLDKGLKIVSITETEVIAVTSNKRIQPMSKLNYEATPSHITFKPTMTNLTG